MIKIVLFLLLISFDAEARTERYYQERWCQAMEGIVEYRLPDKARIDCLTDVFAIEVDFARKWAESIGQSLYYAAATGRKPAVLLIVDFKKDERYLKRFYTAITGLRQTESEITVFLVPKEVDRAQQ